MRAMRSLSPKEKGPGASGSGGGGGGTRSRIAPIGSRTQSFSAAARQHTNASRPPAFSASRRCANAAAGSSKNMTPKRERSEEHTSELQSLMRISYAVFSLKKQN